MTFRRTMTEPMFDVPANEWKPHIPEFDSLWSEAATTHLPSE
jgi:hypothetical protein